MHIDEFLEKHNLPETLSGGTLKWAMIEFAKELHMALIVQAKEMENEKIKEMEFLKFQRDVYIKDIEILKARLREAEQNKN
jgi:hypothetical protein